MGYSKILTILLFCFIWEEMCYLDIWSKKKKKSEHLGWLIEFLAQKQQQSIKVFDLGLDFCKMEVQKRQNQKKMKFFCEVGLVYIAVSGIEELREEKNQVLF